MLNLYNIQHFNDFLNSSIIVLSLIAFIDILILFKNQRIIKFLILTLILCIGVNAFGGLFTYYNYYVRFLVETPTQIAAMAMINFFYQLYLNKWSKFVLISCIFLLLIIIGLPIYFSYTYSLDPINTNFYKNPNTKNLITFIRIFFIIYFLIFGIYILLKIKSTFYQQNIYYNKLRKWCTSWIIISIFSIIFGVSKFLYPNVPLYYYLSFLFIYLSPLLLFIYRPTFLNRTSNRFSLLNIFTDAKNVFEDISEDKLTHEFYTKQYFMNEKANATDFSVLLNVSDDKLKAYVRMKYDMSFIDLVNKHRILYFIELVGKAESKFVTIEALAKECGFGSRQNMSKYFKKFHGGNPSDLINILNQD